MRMLRVALVLFVLASFVAATVAVSAAATVTPTVKPTAKATMKPMSTAKPIKMTGKKMIDLQQMKSTIGDVYKKLRMSVKMPTAPAAPGKASTAGGANKTTAGKTAASPTPVNKTTAGKTTTGKATAMPSKYKPSMKLTTPSLRSVQTPAIMRQMGMAPQLDHANAKIAAPGMSLLNGPGI